MTQADRPLWHLAVALIAAVLLAPLVARAQSGSLHERANPCFAHIAANSMHRVPVYLAVEANDSVTRALLPNVSVFTQTVALRVRALLGQQSNELPQGEPAITWQDASSGATITAYRNARLAWAAADSEWSPAYALLDRALQSMRGEGGPWFLWPDSTVDSLVFDLNLRVPTVNRQGRAFFVVPVHNGVPVFSILEPWEESVHVIRPPHVWYPVGLDDRGVEAVVVVQFVVDTTGRVERGTIRDRWPAHRPRLRGDLERYYRAFLQTVSAALKDARFQPAHIGGCPVRQLAQMPFTFKVRR